MFMSVPVMSLLDSDYLLSQSDQSKNHWNQADPIPCPFDRWLQSLMIFPRCPWLQCQFPIVLWCTNWRTGEMKMQTRSLCFSWSSILDQNSARKDHGLKIGQIHFWNKHWRPLLALVHNVVGFSQSYFSSGFALQGFVPGPLLQHPWSWYCHCHQLVCIWPVETRMSDCQNLDLTNVYPEPQHTLSWSCDPLQLIQQCLQLERHPWFLPED